MELSTETNQETWFFGESRNSSGKKGESRVAGRPDVLIGPKCYISGALQLEGLSVIEGTVEGEVSSSGELVVAEGGVVKARITGAVVKIYGKVIGDIDCQTRLELKKGASVTGNISAQSLVIEDGVLYQGYCTMTQKPGLSVDVVKGSDSSKEPVLELTRAVGNESLSGSVSSGSTSTGTQETAFSG